MFTALYIVNILKTYAGHMTWKIRVTLWTVL